MPTRLILQRTSAYHGEQLAPPTRLFPLPHPTAMLALESSRWSGLEQAYGSAEDVPRLLRHLDPASAGERRELWFGLWSVLWHQGGVYSASYAAVPHLVEFADRRPAAECAEALHLVGAIEIGRLTPAAPTVPDDLRVAYRQAIAAVPGVIARRTEDAWDPDTTQVLTAVLAIAKGHPRFGNAALQLEGVVLCPICDAPHPPAGWDFDADR